MSVRPIASSVVPRCIRAQQQQDATGQIVATQFTPRGFAGSQTDTRIEGASASAPHTLYELLGTNERGQAIQERRGGSASLVTTLSYYANTGRLNQLCSGSNTSIASGVCSGGTLQDLAYGYDLAGNLTTRVHSASTGKSPAELLTYDALNRLTQSQIGTLSGTSSLINIFATQTMSYDALGNLCSQATTGSVTNVSQTYSYAGPAGCANHGASGSAAAVSAISGTTSATYQYDPDGNQTNRNDGRTLTYNVLNQISQAALGAHVTKFEYGPDGNRYLRNDDGVITYYVGKVEIQRTSGAITEMRRYLGAAIDLVIANDTRYTFGDHLGSVDAIAHLDGTRVEAGSFDAWGNRRNPDTWQNVGTTAPLSTTTHGFTGHEHVDNFGFVHMNGRIYDPQVGKMLQADPVQNPGSQGLNRYSYVANNPLSLTDPTGYSWFSNIFRAVAGIAIAIFAPEIFAYYGIEWSLGTAVLTGFVSGAVATGSLQGGLVGAFTAGVFYGIGQGFDKAGWAHDGGTIGETNLNSIGFASKVLAHGIAGGVMSELEGGKFGNGFLSAGISEAAAPAIDKIDPENPVGTRLSAERVVAAAVVGGTTSALTGGNFANGAVTAAFGRAFNDEMSDFRQDQQVKRWANGEISTTQMAQSFNPCYGSSSPGSCAAGFVGTALVAGGAGLAGMDALAMLAPEVFALPAPTSFGSWSGLIVAGETTSDMIMYRIWGGLSGRVGAWLSPIAYASSQAAREGLALPAENEAIYMSEVAIPAGTQIQAGVAAPLFGQPGGALQIFLLDRLPQSAFGPGTPLSP